MELVKKKVSYRMSIPDPEFLLGQWIRVFAEKSRKTEAKTGYITGYVWDKGWTYWVTCPCDRQGMTDPNPVSVTRSSIQPLFEEVPRFPSRG